MTATTASAYDRLLEVLENVKHPNGNHDKARANCPAHDSASRSSLSVKRAEGKALLYCFGGCPTENVLAALGWTKADLYDDHKGNVYTYPDGAYAHRSYDSAGRKKFFQSGNTKSDSTQLYRLEAVEAAKLAGQEIWFVEGEDDVHALELLGVVATTTRGGVGMMGKADLTPLYGARVNVVVDKDKPGDKRAHYLRTMLQGKARTLAFYQAATGKDAQDHIAADHGLDDFQPYEFPADDDDDDPPEPEGRRLKVTRASDITMKATRWLWEQYDSKWIPLGALALLGGREGVGKSTTSYDCVAKITRGLLPGHLNGTPKSVIVCATEDAWAETIVPKLVAAGADLDRVLRVDSISPEGFEGALSLPADVQRLRQLIGEEDVAFVLLDPLLSTLDIKIDSHKDAEVRMALEPLSRLAHDTQVSMLGLIHENKSNAADLLTRIMGSRAFTAVVRAVLYCARMRMN